MKLTHLILIGFLHFFAPVNTDVPKSIYDFSVPAAKGGTIDFSAYKGKKILIINTPSDNDYAYQYKELEQMYQKYKGKLVIIGFLDQDFGPAPGSNKGAEATRERNYNVSFPLAAKVLVKGDNMSPVYKWLTQKKYNNLKDSEIKWDFQKYLINEQGQLVAEFDPKIKLNSPEIAAAIEQ